MAPSAEAMRIWVDVIFTGAEGYQQFHVWGRFSDDNRFCWSKVKHKTMETLMMKLRRSQ